MGIFDLFKRKKADAGNNAASDPMEEIYKDAEKYAAYLEDILAKIPEDKKNEIISLVHDNRKLEAISECRKLTGEGLKVAKDLVEVYLV